DDDPAHRADDPVDGDLPGDPQGLREDAPAVPDAYRVDARDGRYLDPAVYPVQLPGEGLPDPGRGDGDRALHRLLLWPDRLRLCLVLPQDADLECPQPVDAGHPAGARRPDHVLRGWVELVGGLGFRGEQQL